MKKEIRERHSLKFIAILFSVFLWFFVLSSEPIELERTLSLDFNIPRDMAISNIVPKEVKVKIRGSKAFIKTVLNDGDDFKVNLDKYKTNHPKRFFISIHPGDLSLPFGIEVMSITPHEFKLEIDRSVQMEVPILIQVKNTLPEGRLLDEIEVTPKSLIIQGPVEVVSKLSRLRTMPLDLSLIEKDDFKSYIALEEVDRRINFNNGKPLLVKIKTHEVKDLKLKKTRNLMLENRLKATDKK